MSKSVKSTTIKHDLLMNSLQKFFLNDNHLSTIMPIINGKSKISLRVMDWFVTNYSKKNNISYLIDDSGNILDDNSTNPSRKEFVVYWILKTAPSHPPTNHTGGRIGCPEPHRITLYI